MLPPTDLLNPAARTTFTIHSRARGEGATRVEVRGSLDAAATMGFRAVLSELVADREVIIDLTSCTHIDSVGVGAIAGAAARIRERGGLSSVIGPSRSVKIALSTAGAASLLAPCRADRRASATLC